MDKKLKGYYFAFLSRLFILGYFIFAPLSFQFFNFKTTIVLWFGFSTIISFVWILLSGKFSKLIIFKDYWKPITLSGLLNGINVGLQMYGLSIIGPSLSSFLGRFSILFMVLFGVLLLGEKFNYKEALFAIFLFIGVLIITYSNGTYLLPGVLAILCGGFFMAFARYIIKAKMIEVDPIIIVFYRALYVTLFGICLAFFTKSFDATWSIGLLYATVPSIFSVILSHYFVYRAYKYIGISKVGLMTAISPFFVLVLSYLIFGEVLTTSQMIGGISIIIGVIGIVLNRRRIKISSLENNA